MASCLHAAAVQSIHEALEKKVNAKAQIKADLEYYQNYDNVSNAPYVTSMNDSRFRVLP